MREQKLTILEAASGLPPSDQTVTGTDDTSLPVTNLDAEVIRLKRELAEVRIERDILKQIVAYFANAKLSGTRS